MLKIDITRETATDRTVALIGTIAREYLPELEAVVERTTRDHRRLRFDLTQVRLIDREALAFLASCRGRRVRLSGGPAFLREWLKSENRQQL